MHLKKARIEAVVLSMFLLGAMFLVPVSSIEENSNENINSETLRSWDRNSPEESVNLDPFWLDRWYLLEETAP